MLEKEKSDKPIIGGFKKDELDAFTYGFVENAYKILKNNPEKTKKILKGIFKKGFVFGAACAFYDGHKAGYKQALDEFNKRKRNRRLKCQKTIKKILKRLLKK